MIKEEIENLKGIDAVNWLRKRKEQGRSNEPKEIRRDNKYKFGMEFKTMHGCIEQLIQVYGVDTVKNYEKAKGGKRYIT